MTKALQHAFLDSVHLIKLIGNVRKYTKISLKCYPMLSKRQVQKSDRVNSESGSDKLGSTWIMKNKKLNELLKLLSI